MDDIFVTCCFYNKIVCFLVYLMLHQAEPGRDKTYCQIVGLKVGLLSAMMRTVCVFMLSVFLKDFTV